MTSRLPIGSREDSSYTTPSPIRAPTGHLGAYMGTLLTQQMSITVSRLLNIVANAKLVPSMGGNGLPRSDKLAKLIFYMHAHQR